MKFALAGQRGHQTLVVLGVALAADIAGHPAQCFKLDVHQGDHQAALPGHVVRQKGLGVFLDRALDADEKDRQADAQVAQKDKQSRRVTVE